uniref:Unknown protein 7 (Fragments) n=1 Tax=Lonomia obliqua TaxID=304329 RepID=UP07_LONON|nr:RecName: Full=Unknown protein 7 [Lonomia obliqua]
QESGEVIIEIPR